ncbi:hypothetical protein FBQ96_04635 [Nitrospirales bacterium NOB]|jgi:hypothetical protein|nr:hypothetical protein [Nitrospirales bacterium NOB]
MKSMALKATLLYALTILFIPELLYVPIYTFLSVLCMAIGQQLGSGGTAISFFVGLPILGLLFYALLEGGVRSRVNEIALNGTFVEYAGLALLGIWFSAQLLDMYSNSSIPTQVVVPVITAPFTSIGLWFAGLSTGFLASILLTACMRRVWGVK